jgi:large subunit ribosomal protein L32
MTMALARPLPPLWQTLLPAVNGPVRPVLNLPFLQRLAHPFRTLPTPFAAFAIPSIQLPSFPSLGDIWEGILKAVPKKKTSYMKKRTRLMAGKGLKDITSLNKCSACGRVKRAHILCPYCVDGKPFLFLSRSNGIRQNSANRYGSH